MKPRTDQKRNLQWAAKAHAKAIREGDWAAVRELSLYGQRIAGRKVWTGVLAK